jgi:hypothetical protein
MLRKLLCPNGKENYVDLCKTWRGLVELDFYKHSGNLYFNYTDRKNCIMLI